MIYINGGVEMWNITKEAKERFLKYNLLPIHESDEEWEIVIREANEEGEDLEARLSEELEEVKEELLQILPSRFIPYVENGTLNKPTLPKTVRKDYLNWIRKSDEEFEQTLDAASENTDKTISHLSTSVREVFEESLHDAVIDRIDREGDNLHLYINTDGGFSTKSLIHFTFEGIMSELTDEPIQVGQWIVYYELQKTNHGFGFRILFDCPEAEWTITMGNMLASYYYRPKEHGLLYDEDKLQETSFNEYISMLNPENRYWFITPHVECRILSLDNSLEIENGSVSFENGKLVVLIGNERYTYDSQSAKNFIYTDVFEEVKASYEESLPLDKIEGAALGDDLELQV